MSYASAVSEATDLAAGTQAPYIDITEAAAQKVAALIQEEGQLDLKLRVYVMGGGCSGFQYGFAFESAVADDDHVFERPLGASEQRVFAANASAVIGEEDDGEGSSGGASLTAVFFLIDMMSFQYLDQAEIDYVEDVQGARFVIRNPNAKTTCGCGSSFSA